MSEHKIAYESGQRLRRTFLDGINIPKKNIILAGVILASSLTAGILPSLYDSLNASNASAHGENYNSSFNGNNNTIVKVDGHYYPALVH